MEQTNIQLQANKVKGLSGFALKYLALALMVFDHIHYFFGFTGVIPVWFSMLGRLSAPLFLFCVVEGFIHTHDRKRYFLRLYAIAIGMGILQFCFYIIPAMQRPDGFFPQNAVFQSFVILLVILQGIDWCAHKQFVKGIAAIVIPTILPFVVAPLVMNVPQTGFWINLLHFSVLPVHSWIMDGGTIYIFTGVLLYLLRNHRKLQAAAVAAVYLLYYGALMFVLIPSLTFTQLFTEAFEWMGAFSVIFMLMYNGTRGNGSKRLFYWFYPAHVYIFYGLSYALYLVLN